MPVNSAHAILIDFSGDLIGCGSNMQQELGPDGNQWREFERISHPKKIVSVACGYSGHTIAAADDGSLWGWGSNHRGQLGLGFDVPSASEPTRIIIPGAFIVSVGAGEEFSLALDQDGTLFTFGKNEYFTCATGHQQRPFYEPRRSFLSTNISQISCGYRHSVVMNESGLVWVFGDNTFGQLGSGDSTEKRVPLRILDNHHRGKHVAAGGQHTMIVIQTLEVFGCGSNQYGQLGLNQEIVEIPEKCPLENADQVWCGGFSSYVKDKDQRIFVFGSNACGQLALEGDSVLTKAIPEENPLLFGKTIVAGMNHMFAVDSNGSVSFYGALSNTSFPQGDTGISLARTAIKSARK
jgi:alpha-tubulin suppressor-like RCC1 family protein